MRKSRRFERRETFRIDPCDFDADDRRFNVSDRRLHRLFRCRRRTAKVGVSDTILYGEEGIIAASLAKRVQKRRR